jgi:hypothetical protein
MDWIALTQYRDRWRTLVIAVMNIPFPQNAGNFLLAEDLLASQKGLCSMELLVKACLKWTEDKRTRILVLCVEFRHACRPSKVNSTIALLFSYL